VSPVGRNEKLTGHVLSSYGRIAMQWACSFQCWQSIQAVSMCACFAHSSSGMEQETL